MFRGVCEGLLFGNWGFTVWRILVMEVTNEDEGDGIEERDGWLRALEAMKLP